MASDIGARVPGQSETVDGNKLVLDASAMVDLLLGAPPALAIRLRLLDGQLHTPAHFDAEVLSALGRLSRADHVTAAAVPALLPRVENARIQRHPVGPLLTGAWDRRGDLRLVDALYVELAERLGAPIISTDDRLVAAAPRAENPAVS